MRLRIDLPFADEPALRRRTPSRVLIGNGYSFFLASLRGGFHMHTAVAIRNPLFFFDTHRGGKPTLMGRMIDEEFTALRARAKEIDLTSIKEEPAQGTVFKYR